jgi:hypothetical protein
MNSYERYREAMEDAGAPVVVTISKRTHRTRHARTLPCGHDVPAGTIYTKWVGLVDGEFTTDVSCLYCEYGE